MDYFPYSDIEVAYLSAKDKRLGEAIAKIGFIKRGTLPDLFSAVVYAIVGQQISTKAQISIWARICSAVGQVDAEHVLALGEVKLQRCGISYTKAANIIAFARKITTREIDLQVITQMDDQAAIEYLSSLRGIGQWTAEMLLLFCLKRPNILSYGDKAIQRGMCMLYHHRKIDKQKFERYRRRYAPYGSVASLYLWAIAGGQGELA